MKIAESTFLPEIFQNVTIFLATILCLLLSWRFWTSKYSHFHQPAAIPWIGTTLSVSFQPHVLFQTLQKWAKTCGHLYVIWFGPVPVIIASRVEYVEAVLSSRTLLKKSSLYSFLHEWLGTGLLTSHGEKWKNRRRAITPAFHFAILKNFACIFEEQAKILVEKLKSVADRGEAIDIQVPVSLAKLDIICETAMGVKVNAQTSPTSEYVEAINAMSSYIHVRQRSPWFWLNYLYRLSPMGKSYYKSLNVVHNFTINVINKSIQMRKEVNGSEEEESRKVFLDLLLDLYEKGEMDIEGVREEVDTFLFEGHDTTATALSWTLYELGRHVEVQEKLYEEIKNVDPKLSIVDKVKNVKYLDYVIKEGLRLHPPVPLFARVTEVDTVIDNHVIPKGTEIGIFVYDLHRNPAYWENPDSFDPERFGEEKFLKRHPYCYVPFSAGSRNCIGQKFALMEEKIMLYYLMLNYRVTSTQDVKDIRSCMQIIHKSENGLFLEFYKRLS